MYRLGRSRALLTLAAGVVYATALLVISAPATPQVRLSSDIEQEGLAKQGILFGVRLSAAGVRLLRSVEKAYGKPIHQSRLPGAAPGEAGSSGMSTDGTPVVAIPDSVGLREDVIVHELFHLMLYAEGYREINFVAGNGVRAEGLEGLTKAFLHPYVSSQIHHSIFYPRMSRLGLDPVFDQRAFWTQAFTSPFVNGDPSGTTRVYAVLYFQAATQINDSALLARIITYYRGNRLDGALDFGRRLVSLYRRASPLSPPAALMLTVDFCNVLFGDAFYFTLDADRQERRGALTMRIATIQVSARRKG